MDEHFKNNNATAFKKVLPWLENIAFGLLSLWISSRVSLDFDIRLLYIMVLGLIYGEAHSIFAASFSLAIACPILLTQDQLGNEIYIKIFEMFISFFLVAIISGFSKTGSIVETKILHDSYARLELLYSKAGRDLSDAKKAAVVLADQLKTSEQSYGKLYSIIKKIEDLETNELLETVLEVVNELTGFDKSALYIVGNDGITLDLLGSKCLQDLRISDRQTPLFDGKIMMKIIENGRVYLNLKMTRGIPDAVIPIQNLMSGMTYGVITISDIDFDKMSAYTRQMFNFTGELLSNYLTKSIRKKNLNPFNADKGTGI